MTNETKRHCSSRTSGKWSHTTEQCHLTPIRTATVNNHVCSRDAEAWNPWAPLVVESGAVTVPPIWQVPKNPSIELP